MTMPEWEQVAPLSPIWKPTKSGDKLEGTVKKVYEGTYGWQAEIETTKGIFSTPAHKSLQRKVQDLKPDDIVRITFKGMVKGNKYNYGDYMVERRKSAQ